MLLVHRGLFLRSRARRDAAGAVEAGAVHHGRVVDHGAVDVDVAHHGLVHVHDCGVVGKGAASPLAADEADAAVTEAVVNAAVESDVRTPVAGVPYVKAAAEAPVAGCPKHAHTRRSYPYAGNPVVTDRAVGPVSRRPEVAVVWTRRLFVNRECWGPDADGYANRNLRERRQWR